MGILEMVYKHMNTWNRSDPWTLQLQKQRAQLKNLCKRKPLWAGQRTVGRHLDHSSSSYPYWAANLQAVAARTRPFLSTVCLYEASMLRFPWYWWTFSQLQCSPFHSTQSSFFLLHFKPESVGLTWRHHTLPVCLIVYPLCSHYHQKISSNLCLFAMGPTSQETQLITPMDNPQFLYWKKYTQDRFKQFYKCLQCDSLWKNWRKNKIHELKKNNYITP